MMFNAFWYFSLSVACKAESNKACFLYCSFALDTAALLGGNEYLTQQVFEEVKNLEYNQYEKEVLHWALTEVCL